ncbi:hypothetical protein BC830DRAFT_1079927 [Chytriomyces sp. MP71]|nr:hypothetical protein BC830DRAFT_1079927 [Chytriomyces sp. MP71]
MARNLPLVFLFIQLAKKWTPNNGTGRKGSIVVLPSMNIANETLVELETLNVFSIQLNEVTVWITVGISLVQILILWHLAWIETRRKFRWPSFFSPVNIMILFMILSNSGCNVAYFYSQLWLSDTLTAIMDAISNFCFAAFGWLILLYSYTRGKPIMLTLCPSAMIWIRIVLVLSPIMQASYIVLYSLADVISSESVVLIQVGNVLDITCAAILVLVDGLILINCHIYVHKLRSEKEHGIGKDSRLEIVCNYGVLSLTWTLLYEAVTEIMNWFPWDYNSPSSLRWCMGVTTLDSLMPIVFIFIQLAMKMTLFRLKEKDREGKCSSLERAKILTPGFRMPSQLSQPSNTI